MNLLGYFTCLGWNHCLALRVNPSRQRGAVEIALAKVRRNSQNGKYITLNLHLHKELDTEKPRPD